MTDGAEVSEPIPPLPPSQQTDEGSRNTDAGHDPHRRHNGQDHSGFDETLRRSNSRRFTIIGMSRSIDERFTCAPINGRTGAVARTLHEEGLLEHWLAQGS